MGAPQNDNYLIPKWFIRVASTSIGIAVPWGMWVTIQLNLMDASLKNIEELHGSYNAHVGNPDLHYSRSREVNMKLDSIDKRLDRVEKGGK